ncbi:hypothetical protein PILCRDRAFT_820340 [Piloderma croceum F 1598]|uniref:DUF6534 domain-containing protein n=1 Tax=Piloderma croceum (strain F 1598) TaxID=765440 RepID=A0A0C3FRU5_PILCF|nr:hypothetical protein PILCRDRAFT_820340 [Piloderma croceum F 1598]
MLNSILSASVLDTVHVCLVSDSFWDILLHARPLQKPSFTGLSWQLTTSFTIVVFVMIIVQSFFCLRVWKVSGGNRFIVTIIILASVIQFGIAVCTYEYIDPTNKSRTLPRLNFISCLVCDGTIAASLVYFFRNFRVGQPRTEPVLQQLIVLSVNTGTLLCVITAMMLALFETKRGSAFLLAPQFISGKLYTNTLIATLNSRRGLRELVDRSIAFSLPTIPSSISTPAVV